ncbi:MAG: Gldg family protein [Verrucomicrobiota bacterium]
MPEKTANESRPSYSALQRWSSAFNVSVSVLAVLAIVVMVNYLAIGHSLRAHWSGSAAQPLSPLTHQVLESLTNQVRIVVFFDKADPLYSSVSKLINEYRLACSKLIIETVDPDRDPSGAATVREKYKLSPLSDNNVVIFECNDKAEAVYGSRLSDYNVDELVKQGKKEGQVKRTAFKGEMMFTSAIVAVTDPRPYKVYFMLDYAVGGKEQHELGYENLRDFLADNKIQYGVVDLVGTNDIPGSCDLLLIAGRKMPFLDDELRKLDRYLTKGGRALILLNQTSATGLETYLTKWGVAVGEDRVFDPQNCSPGYNDLYIRSFGLHPTVRPIAQSSVPIHFATARTVGRSPSAPRAADAPQVEEIAFTGEQGVAYQMRNGQPTPGPRDRVGKLPVAVAVEKGGLKGVNVERGATRLIVTGDAYFLNNHMLRAVANRDFAWHSIQWLLDRSRLTEGIGPRPVNEFVLRMTSTETVAVRWILLAALPGSVLFLGLLVWLQRRH